MVYRGAAHHAPSARRRDAVTDAQIIAHHLGAVGAVRVRGAHAAFIATWLLARPDLMLHDLRARGQGW